ncbi:hypothetical protein KAR91_48020 [Candidatus Pacearchaeota archaeon]|nr:hypothetical protein [Candidatus Pacearchaeota archaeon]
MSKYYVMVTFHRLAVGEADTEDEIKGIYDRLSEYEGYKGKMKILQEVDFSEGGKYPFPDLDSNIDEEETIHE